MKSKADFQGKAKKVKNLKNSKQIITKVLVSLIVVLNFAQAVPSYAALISLEGQRKETKNLRDTSASRVLISKESVTPALNYVVRADNSSNSKVLISYEETEFDGTFVLRQAADQQQGILADRPDSLDMRILKIIEKEKINSIEAYAQWIKKNFTYRKDANGDVWAKPSETLAKQFGDCEDFAFLNAAALRVFGYKPTVFGLGGGIRNVGHAVCAFKKNGKYMIFDNNNLRATNSETQEALSNDLIKSRGYAYMFEVTPDMETKNTLSQGGK